MHGQSSTHLLQPAPLLREVLTLACFPITIAIVQGLLIHFLGLGSLTALPFSLAIAFGVFSLIVRKLALPSPAILREPIADLSPSKRLCLLLASHLPFLYLLVLMPERVAHISPDLLIVSVVFAQLFIFLPPREALPMHHLGAREYLALTLLLLASLALRLWNLDYNAPYIDELLNFEISTIGNKEFIASDSRLWGVICRFAYEQGGLLASRAANGILGTIGVYFVYRLALAFLGLIGQMPRAAATALLAAALYSVSTPVLFTSRLATHDSLALVCFIAGLSFAVQGMSQGYRRLLVLGAFLLFLSFAARYFIFVIFPTMILLTHSPLIALSAQQRRNSETWFYCPMIAFFLIYFSFDADHIISSVALGARLGKSIAERSYPLVTSALFLFTLPLVLLGTFSFLARIALRRSSNAEPDTGSDVALESPGYPKSYLLLSALLLPAVQLITCSDFGSEKNLSYSALFAAVLIAMLIRDVFAERKRQPLRVAFAGALVGICFLFGMKEGVHFLLPKAIRSEHSLALQRAIQDLNANPFSGAFRIPLQMIQQRWLSPHQILEEVQALGLDKQDIAVFGMYGGEHTNWYLTHHLGRNPETAQYYADQNAPWVDNFGDYIRERQIPVLIGVFPEIDPKLFERIPDGSGYHLVSQIQLEEVDGPWGRVFFWVNPRYLAREHLHGPWQKYFESFLQYRIDIPAAARIFNSELIRELFNEADSASAQLPHAWQRISLLLERARAQASVGNGVEAQHSFATALRLGEKNGNKKLVLSMIKELLPRTAAFRVPAGISAYAAQSENLLERATQGSISDEKSKELDARANWLDFSEPLHIPAGTLLRIDASVHHSQIAGLRLIEKDDEYSRRGYMELFPLAEGRQVYYIAIRDDRNLKQINMQVGPKAWGKLGGTLKGRVEFHHVSIERIEPSAIYISDPKRFYQRVGSETASEQLPFRE